MMLEERNLILFTPFYFPDNGASKDKYFIVLKNDADTNILASLPTRRDNVPAFYDDTNGCISFSIAEHGFDMTCYRIEKNVEIIENSDFSFPFPTHIYGSNLKLLAKSYFEFYPHEGIDYSIVGKINQALYDDLIKCLKESSAVKKGYKKFL